MEAGKGRVISQSSVGLCIQIRRMPNKVLDVSLCIDLLAFRAVPNDVNTCKQLSNQSLERLLNVNKQETNLVQLGAGIKISSAKSDLLVHITLETNTRCLFR